MSHKRLSAGSLSCAKPKSGINAVIATSNFAVKNGNLKKATYGYKQFEAMQNKTTRTQNNKKEFLLMADKPISVQVTKGNCKKFRQKLDV